MNILIVGDSFSSLETDISELRGLSQSGFKDPIGKSWVSLIQRDNVITNLSLGGQSNQSIFNRTVLEIIKNKDLYDLIIVQWSTLLRINFTEGKTIYRVPIYFTPDSSPDKFKKFHEIWVKNFLHARVALLEWMSQIIVLDNFLKQTAKPYIFIKTFDNFLEDLKFTDWRDASSEFKSSVLYKDSLPDDEIEYFHRELRDLFTVLEMQTENNWLNLRQISWAEELVDYADDALHPGEKTHEKYFRSIVDHIKRLGLTI